MKNMLNPGDRELIQASQSGDQAAFGQLVTRYQSLICAVAYNRCGDVASSEDLAQEAFVQAWKRLSDLQEANSFKSWLCTIVRNLANRRHSRQAKKPMAQAASLEAVAEVAEVSEDPATAVLREEQQQLVWNALSEIPETYREPMILFYREEQSVGRVAEALDLTPDAVKQRLSRGRKMLHAQMVETVEKTLGESRPSDNFASAVMMGIGGGAKATMAGAAAKATSLLSGSSGMFWLSLAQLPLVAWLVQVAIKDARSETERALVIRHLILSGLGLIPMIGLMSAYVYFQPPVPSPLNGLVIPAIMVMYMVPMILYSRKLGKQMELLREEEGTATPPQSLEVSTGIPLTRLFLGSGMLVSVGMLPVPAYMGQWSEVLWMLLAAFVWPMLARLFAGSTPRRGLIAFSIGLGLSALSCLGLSYLCVSEWHDQMENASFWFLAGIQIQGVTLVLLLTYANRRVFGA